MTTAIDPCIACGSERTSRLDDRWLPIGVTSDCKPWPRCGEFLVCEQCGHVQKRQDSLWQKDVAEIYREYQMYVLSNGNEQVIFDAGAPAPRTRRLLELFCQRARLPATGDWLDIGCGNGSTLRTFAGLHPGWRLAGYDVHNRFEAAVRGIPGVNGFYHGSLDTIDRQFDVISMVYVIEHIPQPLEALKQLDRVLKPGGILLLHTSNYWDNPFDLAVVDHCSHFTRDTLASITFRAGYEVLDSNDDWIAKEIGVIGRRGNSPAPTPDRCVMGVRRGANQRLRWLGEIVEEAKALPGIGIFGTAIAGTWLASMAPEVVRFFVDEDLQRTGKTHLGVRIHAPRTAPHGVPVYLAFPPPVASKIQARLSEKYPQLSLKLPPLYEPLSQAA